jgi:hypothetical protein
MTEPRGTTMVTAATHAQRHTDLTHVRSDLRGACTTERTAATAARQAGDARGERHHLQRAHVLSEPLVGLHLRTLVALMSAAIRGRDQR